MRYDTISPKRVMKSYFLKKSLSLKFKNQILHTFPWSALLSVSFGLEYLKYFDFLKIYKYLY